MTKKDPGEGVDEVRRKLLRTSIVLGGAFAAGQIPYSRPQTKSFFGVRSAWAQPSVVYTITCSFEVSLPVPPVAGQACQEAVIQNITAQATPIPPVGTLLRCSPTTDDPANMGLLPDDSLPTDAAGQVMFADFNFVTNVPNPLLSIGSIFTMTVTFDDQATFGTASCSNQLTIIGC
jgi:hypothetical protein